NFVDGILDASEGTMARAHALANLAERFPRAEEQKLTAEQQGILRTLRKEHETALKEFAGRMVQLVEPVLTIPEKREAGLSRAESWQDNARNLLDSARQVDRLLNQMLAGDSSAGAQRTPQELAAALASLRAQVSVEDAR